MSHPEDERGARKQLWDKWDQERQTTRNLEQIGININDDKQEDYLAQLTLKLAERTLGAAQKQTKDSQLERKVCKEVEANTCAVCFELMVPPNYSPILLFPCGHTFCNTCLLEKNNKKLKVFKCPLCRQKIQSHAINISLQNLICLFSNQKHLLDEPVIEQQIEKEQPQEGNFSNLFKMYKMRCEILIEEKQGIDKDLFKMNDELETQYTVIESLKIQRSHLKKQLQQIQSQMDDVSETLESNLGRVEQLNAEVKKSSDKKLLIDQTLQPLTLEMKKYHYLSEQI